MKIGIISDTHDRLPFIDRAIRKMNEEEVDLVLHAGDYCAPFAAFRFKPLKAKMIGVFGNNDAEKELLRRNFKDIGVEIRGRFAEIKVDGLKIALLHGEETELLNSLLNTGSYNVVIYGHTHQSEIRRKNGVLVINPGEACGYLSGKATIGLLDTSTLDAVIVPIQ
ncbi:metallophosphoesterase [Candidatus Bathyarchaeota archaeon]|nr:MAG: metallophosphoesterase [Candidatus Bathyarchaeota archaeon]